MSTAQPMTDLAGLPPLLAELRAAAEKRQTTPTSLSEAVLALNAAWNRKEPEEVIAGHLDLCRRLAIPQPKTVASCCGRSECGGECGNEWSGMELPAPFRCIKPHCPSDCDGCNHAIPNEPSAKLLIVELLDAFANDGHGATFEDGDCTIVDRARAFLATPTSQTVGLTRKQMLDWDDKSLLAGQWRLS